MAPVTVVMDTTGYLPPEVAAEHGIEIVSLYVNFEGGARTVKESELMTQLDTVYEEVRGSDPWPTTSQPSIGDFIACYEPLLAARRDVVSIHISEGISGTAGSARQAAEQLEREGKGGERVHVLDSSSAAGGMGLIGLAAARLARTGAGAEAVLERANAARADLKMWFAIDTLEFLKRSGRIGAASAWIGSTLKIKPILSVESEIMPVERVRTSARMFERMVDYARQREASGANAWVVQHIQTPEAADRLADECRAIFGCEPVFTSEIGAVLGVHTGPGLLGVGSVPPQLLG